MQRKFVQSFHVPGTLSADLNIRWTAPSNCSLVHVSAVSSNTAAFGLELGDSTDTNGYLTKASSGVSNTPVEKELADFTGALVTGTPDDYPRISDGDVLVITVDYDYNGGGGASASADATIVLTFVEG